MKTGIKLEGKSMVKAYDDRDGHIWMDGNFLPWRNANIHILSHALHYGSSVFEGERAYNGKIFKSEQHSQRLIESGKLIDVPVPYSIDEIENAKLTILKDSKLKEAYIRVICWRASGEDMGVASQRNKVRMAIAAWEWGAYYGDAKFKGARLDISKWKRPRRKLRGQTLFCILQMIQPNFCKKVNYPAS